MNSEKKDKDKDDNKTEVILDNITIRRGARLVLRDFSLAIKSGEAWAVQGGNGAGKTTLLRLLAGLVRPTMGCLRLIGAKNRAQAAHYLGHLDGLKNLRTVHEEIIYQAALYGTLPPNPTKFLHILGLAECAPMPIGDLSAGQRRRLTLARLLLAPRPLWLLDEPFTALDEQGCALVAQLVATHIKKGGMAVVASHAPLNFATHHLDLEEKNN